MVQTISEREKMISAKIVEDFYENAYKEFGFGAQRKYPNEEFCRFMGRNFFHKSPEERKRIKILETGCGSGANLWMIAKEGFDAHGIDLSSEAIFLAEKMLESYGVAAELSAQNMCDLNFQNNNFDAVVDVFSSYCFSKKEHLLYLQEIKRILKPGGLFFSYFPAKQSDAYLFPKDSRFIDSDTLESITRENSPFCGQNYPFRFIHSCEYEQGLKNLDFDIQYSEMISRTYHKRQEVFSFVVIEAKKGSI